MRREKLEFLFVVAVGLLLGTSLLSCKKEEATVAKILVVDTDGKAVSNAMVRLYGTPTMPPPDRMIFDDTLYTDATGYANFDFTNNFNLGQSGFTVLDIEVLSDEFMGEGIIKITEEKTNEETVILQ